MKSRGLPAVPDGLPTLLAELAQSVPADVIQIEQGKSPKDADDRLKRIEKISQQLRGELTR